MDAKFINNTKNYIDDQNQFRDKGVTIKALF